MQPSFGGIITGLLFLLPLKIVHCFEFFAPSSWLYQAREAVTDLIISSASCYYNVYIFRKPHAGSGECLPEKHRDASEPESWSGTAGGTAAGFQLYPQTVPLRRWFNSSYASFSSLSIMPMGLTPPHSCCKMYGPKEMFLLHAGGSANTDSPDVPENRGLTT